MKLGGVLDTWHGFSTSQKRLFWGMISAGIGLFAFGATADLYQAEWLKTYAFLPNILVGFTSFLVGVPVALVGLSTITGQREERAAIDRVQGLTEIAWIQFRDAIYEFCRDERSEALGSKAEYLQAVHDQTVAGFQNYVNSDGSQHEYTMTIEFSRGQIHSWMLAFTEMMDAVGSSSDLQLKWFAIIQDWNTLDQYVRLQRLERKLQWFGRNNNSYLRQWLVEDKHPMLCFFDKHEGPAADVYDLNNGSMYAAYRTLDHLLDMEHDADTFYDVLLSQTSGFPLRPVSGYLEAAGQAAANMRKLLYTVQDIDEAENWPKKFDHPA